MKLVFEKIPNQMALEKRSVRNPLANENGSIIIVALMVLVIMTVIGLLSADTVQVENFIIRNQAIYKQNMSMADAAMMEAFQRFMQIPPDSPNIVDVDGSALAWVNDMHDPWAAVDWYNVDTSARLLDATNSLAINTAANLADRGENAAGNLRAAFVGWETVPLPGGGSESLGVGSNEPVWRAGRIMSEYVSLGGGGADHGYGMMRMEIGIKRRIVLN
ncbi:MAG: pilus assembly PilX N-terminal domain-containing protein [Desulfobacterales bacterium]|jgi:hypothetical protein|nr:pilus assembly PilX N-terminal domain-containing protein [Desulfobacterales bacterium]